MSFARYERRGAVGLVTLDRPERLNAISDALLSDLAAALERALHDPETGALVLTGAGAAFCAGDDLKEFTAHAGCDARIRAHVVAIQGITRLLLAADKPVIAAAHGYAVGGGFEWLLNCDMVIAADDLVAFFPEMQWGLFVTGGITHLLPRLVGYQRAMELLLLGERQTAARLADLGIVNWVVPRADLLPLALELAQRIAGASRFSVGNLKRALNRDLEGGLRAAIDLEERITIEAYGQPDTAERVRRFATRSEAG